MRGTWPLRRRGPTRRSRSELERSAGRAQARGGLAAAAAFLQRAVALTGDPARRADRALAAAQASLRAGAFDVARGLLAAAEAGPLDELGRARVDLLRAEVAFAQNRGGDAPLLLLQAARKLETLDVRLARNTYLDAWARGAVRRPAGRSGRQPARRLARRRRPRPIRPIRRSRAICCWTAWRSIFTEGRAAAAPVLRRAVAAFASAEVSAEEMLRWGWLATRAANLLWDYDCCLEIGTRAVAARPRLRGARGPRRSRTTRAVRPPRSAATSRRAALLIAEVDAVKEATRTRIAPHAAIALAGIRGREAEATELIDGVIAEATAGGQGTAVQYARWASVRAHERARPLRGGARGGRGGERATRRELYIAAWALSELIEAATRTGHAELAERALDATRASTRRPRHRLGARPPRPVARAAERG